jgi:ABC-type antimicrobial peptide transport system permease subunit
VLRATGFTRAQVLISVCTQSVAIAVVAVVIGLPLGIVSGRVAWGALAHSIGAVSETIVPPTLALLPPAVLLFALVVAVIPGLRAIRVLPANALRSE